MFKVNDVVQFNENHKWCGCLGIVTEDKGYEHPGWYLIRVPIPMQGVAYIYDDGSGIEEIGRIFYRASRLASEAWDRRA